MGKSGQLLQFPLILCIYSPFAREDAYSMYSPFGYAPQQLLQHVQSTIPATDASSVPWHSYEVFDADDSTTVYHLPAYAVQTDLLSQICLRQQIKIVECKGEKSVEQHKKGSCSNCSARMRTSFGIRQSEKNSSPPHSFFFKYFRQIVGNMFLVKNIMFALWSLR